LVTVTLESVGNPDYNQYGVLIPLQEVEVDSIEAASAACRSFITENDLGSGNWGPNAGVVREDGEMLGQISYNGRFWPIPTEGGSL